MTTLEPPTLAAVRAARQRIADHALRTPLVRLNVDDAPAEIYLKLENLQPIGSFKIRGAGNAILSATPDELATVRRTAGEMNLTALLDEVLAEQDEIDV